MAISIWFMTHYTNAIRSAEKKVPVGQLTSLVWLSHPSLLSRRGGMASCPSGGNVGKLSFNHVGSTPAAIACITNTLHCLLTNILQSLVRNLRVLIFSHSLMEERGSPWCILSVWFQYGRSRELTCEIRSPLLLFILAIESSRIVTEGRLVLRRAVVDEEIPKEEMQLKIVTHKA